MHRATRRFWKLFDRLPLSIQTLARENFELLKQNSSHPSLHFKKAGKYWSARIGLDYRVVAIEDSRDFIWIWIGPHDEYDRLINE